MNKKRIVLMLVFILCPVCILAQGLINSKHNLSVSGQSLAKSGGESDMCRFCHTTHISRPKPAQWRKNDTGQNYILYSSSTIQALPGQPTGASLLCLSCHDGTIALGSSETSLSANSLSMMPNKANLTTDLSDDHPISFTYNSTLALANRELADPAFLPPSIELEKQKVQCTSCHDPHNQMYDYFLSVSYQYSELCIQCHQIDNWNLSAHKISNATWKGFGRTPWFHTPYTTVEENGCENCHNPHGAESHDRLLNFRREEDNCLICHNGSVASTDIRAMQNKPFTHNVYAYNQIHDPAEENIVRIKHVECSDCHNPHSSRKLRTRPPLAEGSIKDVKGVDTNGNPIEKIQFQYELCYRCHSGNAVKPGSPTSRQIEQSNVRFEFDLGNPSYHPIEGSGKNSNVPSLILPRTETSIIYCTNCHSSDGSRSPAGPHGSIYPHILKYRYETTDFTPESYQSYELCYQCHNRDIILNSMETYAQKVHKKHIKDVNTPCNVCHDPHGISSAQGNAANHSYLINFDIRVVSADQVTGRLEFNNLGMFSGNCYLQCHGKNHSPATY